MNRWIGGFLTGILVLSIMISPGNSSAADFYEGKVVTILSGSPPGGGRDRVARFVAKSLPKYLPGKPSIIVQNNAGGSGMIAANQLYRVIKPDGLTIFGTHRGLAFMQLLKVDGVEYDIKKFEMIGSVAADSNVLCIRNDLPYKTFQELKNSKKQIFLGGGGPGSITTQMSFISRDFLGLNAKVIEYRGSADSMLAIEQKEIDGIWIAYNSGKPHIARGLIRPLVRSWVVQKGIEHLPVNEDLTTDPKGKAVMALLGRTAMMGQLYLAPPGTPANVMKIIRDAFDKMLKDPQVQAESEKAQLDLRYIPAEECTKLIRFIFEQPPEIVKIFSQYVAF
ncbi:MAG: Bug family tripartite tricarboxylate transporter substrate binding protein [Thermodesulfobacteriota bacterium]